MGKERSFIDKLKKGESVSGKIEEVDSDAGLVILEQKDESLIEVRGIPEHICERIGDDFSGDIIELIVKDDGTYSVKELDDFPDEKEKKK